MSRLSAYYLAGCAAAGLTGCGELSPPPPPPAAAPSPAPPVAAEQKLDATLLALVNAYDQGGDRGLADYVQQAHLTLDQGRAPVVITVTAPEHLPAIRDQILAAHGVLTAHLGPHQYALLPVSAIRALAALEPVWTMASTPQAAFPLTPAPGGPSPQPSPPGDPP